MNAASTMRRASAFVLCAAALTVFFATASFAASAATASRAGSAAAPQSQDTPAVRAIGVLRSADRRQSRAILQVNGGAPADYAEGDALPRGWSVERIDKDSVRISDGARHMQVPVEGGEAHPALRPLAPNPPVAPSTPVLAAPQVPASASKQVLEDAARRRAIHLRRTD